MELHQLKIFLKVAALKNFTGAATQLNYSQSNISAQIRQLEKEVGHPLFNRIGRHVSLTQYGEQLVPYARKLLSQAREIEDLFREEDEISGTVRIGMVESLCNALLVPSVMAYHRRFPRIKTDLTIDSTNALMDMLRKDCLDVACLVHDPFIGSDWFNWGTEEMPVVVIANGKSELVQQESVSMEQLAGKECILMEEGAPYSSYFRHQMSDRGIPYQEVLTLQDPEMACRLVAEGDFISVLPLHISTKYTKDNAVAVLPMKDFSFSQYAQILLHPSKIVTPQLRGFLEELEKGYRHLPRG